MVKSAERTVRLLEVFGSSPARLSLSDLHRVTGYPRSSLHQLVQTLVALRWLEPGPDGLSYSVGPHALLTGTAYLDRDPAVPLAIRQLDALEKELGYTCHFARLDERNVIYLATKETHEVRHVLSRIGRQLPAHATALGQAMLADRSSAELDVLYDGAELEPLTQRTITDLDELRAELDRIRERGYAIEAEQNSADISCVAATVPYRIPATDAISCSLPLAAASEQEVARVGEAVVRHAAELASALRRAGVR
ncbi:IclR family transcriptional regulator [Microbacterium sp. NPDC058342]|uniref:IclR family transcriptional regulator n=1 Tax=Microbacterium sp. NPDC058342 TaxID=3346454 RepID=UPI00365EE565